MRAVESYIRFTYAMINNDPPEYLINDDKNELPPVRVPSVQSARKTCEILNKQFKKPLDIPDKEMNNLAYYCSMIFEMFLTINWEYEKIGKGTTHHEIIRAGTETLSKEYYYKGFREILKELGYDDNFGEDLIE